MFNLQPLDEQTQSPLFQRRRVAQGEETGQDIQIVSVDANGRLVLSCRWWFDSVGEGCTSLCCSIAVV